MTVSAPQRSFPCDGCPSPRSSVAATVSAKISFRADPAIRLGGLSVLSADGRRCRNHTLDEAYASQLRNFYRNHKIGGGDK